MALPVSDKFYRPRKDERLSWLTCLPTLVVTHQLQVERRTGKVRQSETDVLPLCHATNLVVVYYMYIIKISHVITAWVLNNAGVKRELLSTVKARKLAYYRHTVRKQGSCPEKEKMQGTMPHARRRGRPRTAWMDNTKTWTGLPVEESIRMTEDRDTWRNYVHGVANPRTEDCSRTEQNTLS